MAVLAAIMSLFGQRVLTFEEAVQAALENNYGIRIREKSVELADNNLDNKYGQAGALPSVNATGAYQYQNSSISLEFPGGIPPTEQSGVVTTNTNLGLQLNWTVFDGFAMWVNMDRLELMKDMSQIQLQIEIENTIRSLAQAYYNGISAKRNAQLLRENIARNTANLERLEVKKEFGQALTTDILRAEVSINTDSSAILQSNLAYTNARYQLQQLMGITQEVDFELEDEISLENLPALREARQTALNQNSAILLAVKDKELTKTEYDLVISQYYPRLTLTGGYTYQRSESDGGFFLLNESNGFTAGANLNWNLFNGFQTQTAAENAQLNEEMKDIAIQRVRNTVDMNFMVAYDNLAQRLTLLELERSSLKSARSNYERAEELFRNGQITSLELRDAQLQLLSTQNRINTAIYIAKLAETELNILMGQIAQAQE